MRYRTTNYLYLSLLLLLGNSTIIIAQVPDQLYFENFTVEDGLPANDITDISQDSLGYIWIAATGGIARYDGYEFEVYRNIPGDQTSLSDDEVDRIVIDIYGNIWVENFVGIDLFDPATNKFIRYFQDPSSSDYIASGSKTVILSTSSGLLLIGTAEDGLISYHPVTKEFKRFTHNTDDSSSISANSIFDLKEDQNGIIWFSTPTTGLNKFDPESGIFTNITFEKDDPDRIPNDLSLSRLFIDDDHVLWVSYFPNSDFQVSTLSKGDEAGIWQMDLNTGEYLKLLYDPIDQPLSAPFFFPLETDDNTVWFARDGFVANEPGLYGYSKKDGSYRRYTYDSGNLNSLISNAVTVVFEDVDGNLWSGTEFGLSKANLSRKQFEAFIPMPGNPMSPENYLTDILNLGDNTYLIMRDDSPAIIWDKKTGEWTELDHRFFPATEIISDFRFRQRWFIEDGVIWSLFNTQELHSYNLHTKQINKYFINSSGSTNILSRMISSDGKNIWLGTSKGVSKFDISDKTFTNYKLTSDYSDGDSLNVAYIVPGIRGNIWAIVADVPLNISKEKQGTFISSFDPKSEMFTNVSINENYYESLAHGYALDVMEDMNGDLWISNSNGLIHYDVSESSYKWYNQNDGLSGLYVNNSIDDGSGNIWLNSGTYGLTRFDPEEKVFRNFGRSDGIISLSISSVKIYNDLIFAVGVGGMNIIDPAEIEENSNFPEVLITGILLNGNDLKTEVRVEDLNKIEIPWGNSGLEIEYTAIDFNAADKTTYTYKLEGLHDEFQVPNYRRYAQFTTLEPGDYTFRVRATNAEGISSLSDTVLNVSVLPPWWRTWWAYAMYVLMFAGGVYAVDRIQRRRVLYKEKERAREKELKQAKKIEEAYAELERSLINLKATQQQLVQQEKLASLGQLTAGIAHEIKNPLNFVNNFSELSIEMVEEAREELLALTPQPDEALQILSEIEANLNKIHEHGSRADSIVKSMLQHSRGGSGKLTPTDLNALVLEFVNLSFHGMRAGKDPISVDLNFELSDEVGQIPLMSEDFSRVIINLCNNAFDAMRDKKSEKEKGKSESKSTEAYKPQLTVRTSKKGKNISLEIRDNGPGIPKEMQDKILQPFFTTKKGSEGTGLGLSITNDIISAHGGMIDIESEPGMTKFIITFSSTLK